MNIKILIADDHPIFREGLKEALQQYIPNVVVIEAKDGQEALENARKSEPDYCILDVNMPLLNGMEVGRKLKQEMINTKIIFLSMHSEAEIIKKCILYGGSGYILKDNSINEILECIKRVSQNKTYISPVINQNYVYSDTEHKKYHNIREKINSLTKSELKVLKLVHQGYSTKEIAEILFLSEKTIENYRSKICQKLQLPARNNSLLLWIGENKEWLGMLSEF